MLPDIWYRFDDSEVLCEFSNQILIFFWSFRHRTTSSNQEIWNFAENKAVKGWVYVLSQPKKDHGQFAKCKQGTPNFLARIEYNFQFFDSHG